MFFFCFASVIQFLDVLKQKPVLVRIAKQFLKVAYRSERPSLSVLLRFAVGLPTDKFRVKETKRRSWCLSRRSREKNNLRMKIMLRKRN